MRSDASIGISQKEYTHHNQLQTDSKASFQPSNISIDLPHYLVFIYGMEVTESVVALNFNHNLDGDPGIATIELMNNEDQWVVTPRNLGLTIFTGDSRAHSPGEFVQYGVSDETPGGNHDFVKKANNRSPDNPVPSISVNYNTTGGAVDHRMGLRDAYNQDLVQDVLNNTEENKRAWKNGKIIVKKLFAKDNFGKDTTELLGLNGRFRLDPFSSSLNINLDNWYEMYHEAIKQPELFRYSEYKKMLIYLTKANALIAYHNDDTRGIEELVKRWELEQAAVNTFNANRKFDQIKETTSDLNVEVAVDIGQTKSTLTLTAKDIPTVVTIDPNTKQPIHKVVGKPDFGTGKPITSIVDPNNTKIILNNDETDIDVHETVNFNAFDKNGFGAEHKLQDMLKKIIDQKNQTSGSSGEELWEIKIDKFDPFSTDDKKKAVFISGKETNVPHDDVVKSDVILPPFSINIEGTIISNLNNKLKGLGLAKVQDSLDDPNGWTFYLSKNNSVSVTVAPTTLPKKNIDKGVGFNTFTNLDDDEKSLVYYRVVLSDGGTSNTSFQTGTFQFKENMKNALKAIKDTFVTFTTGEGLTLLDNDEKKISQKIIDGPISSTDSTPVKKKIAETFVQKGLKEIKIFGFTDPSLGGELLAHADGNYTVQPQNLNLLNLPYDIKFQTDSTGNSLAFEFTSLEAPKIVNFDPEDAQFTANKTKKGKSSQNNEFDFSKNNFVGLGGARISAPPSIFENYAVPFIKNGNLEVQMAESVVQVDNPNYKSGIIEVEIDENAGQIILTISKEANVPLPDISKGSNKFPYKPIYQFVKLVQIGSAVYDVADIPELVFIDNENKQNNPINPQRMVINYRFINKNSFSKEEFFNLLDEANDTSSFDLDDVINIYGLNRCLNNLGFGFKVVKFNVISSGIIPTLLPNIKDPGTFKPEDTNEGGILDPKKLDTNRVNILHVTYKFYFVPPLQDGIISVGLKTGRNNTDGELGVGMPAGISNDDAKKVLACMPDLRFNETGLFRKSANYIVNDGGAIQHREWNKNFNNWRTLDSEEATQLIYDYHYARGFYNGSWTIDGYRGQQNSNQADFTLDKTGVVIGSSLNDFSIPLVVSDHYNSALGYARANEVRNFFIYDEYNQNVNTNTEDSDLEDINDKFFIKGGSFRNSIDEFSLLPQNAAKGDSISETLITNLRRDSSDSGKAINRRIEIIIVIDKKPFDDLASAGSGKQTVVRTTENVTPHSIIYKQTYSLIKKSKPDVKTFDKPKPTNAPIITRLYPMRPGDPIFHSMDPVRIFERSKYPERWVDEDGKVFDDHVYYHAFSGFVESLQKSTSGGDRRLIVEAKDMKRLLQISKLAVKPAVVNERNLDTNLLGLTPFQENYVLDSVRTLCERIIGAKGEFNKSGGVNSIPTNAAKNLIQAQQNSADGRVVSANEEVDRAQGVGLGSITNIQYLFINKQYVKIQDILKTVYGITLRFYLRNALTDTKTFPFNLGDGFSDGKISGKNVTDGVLNVLGSDLTTNPKFLNENIFSKIRSGEYKVPTLADFENVFHAGLTLDQYVDFFNKTKTGNGTENFTSFGTEQDFVNGNPIIIVAFRDPKFENFSSPDVDIKTLPYALQVSRAESAGKALLKSPQNQVQNKDIKPIVDANKSHIVVSDDALRYIDPVKDQFIEIFDPKKDPQNNNINSTSLVNDKLDEAFQKCISKPRNRIFPYVRTPSGVGNYGVRVATILGSVFEDIGKDGKPVRNPNLSNTAKQFQAVWELEEMHPRYRNPQVIRDTFGILPILFALPLQDFKKYNGSLISDSGNGEVDSVALRELRKTWEQINKDSKRIDNFILDALGEKFFELLDKVGDAQAGNIINALDPQKDINAQALLNASTDPTVAGYIKSTLMDILIKHEIECGYLYIMEPQGFVSSTIHPYNPHIDGFSLFDFNMKDRLQIINEATQNIGFHFYATPKGDFVMQPPMLPFSPRHFSLAYDEHGMTGKKKATTTTVTKQVSQDQSTNTNTPSIFPLSFTQDSIFVKIESPNQYFLQGTVANIVNDLTKTLPSDVPDIVSMQISIDGDKNHLIPVDNLLGPIAESTPQKPHLFLPNGFAGPYKQYSWTKLISGAVPKQIPLLLQTTDSLGNTKFQYNGTAKTLVDFTTTITVPDDVFNKINVPEAPKPTTVTIETPDTSITKRIGGGLYNRQYFLDSMHITSIDWREDSSKIVNAVEAVGAFPFFKQTQEGGADPWRAVIMRGDLIGRYGLRFEVFHNEILRSQSNAAAYAYIKMQEINRTVLTVAVHAQTCPSLLLCRPLEIPREYVCGYIKHISVSWSASNGRQTQIELWDCRKINVNSGSVTFVPLTDFDRVDLLNMQSFWTDRKAGRSIDDLKHGQGSDSFISEANRFESQIFQQDLGINSMVKLNESTSILNFDLTNQMALVLSDPQNDATLREFLNLNSQGTRQGFQGL